MSWIEKLGKIKKKADGYVRDYEKSQEKSREERISRLKKRRALLREEVAVKKLERQVHNLEKRPSGNSGMGLGFGLIDPPRKKKGRREIYVGDLF